MILLEEFYRAIGVFRPLPDEEQKEAIEKDPQEPLFIVAGPGTGKTTCLTLRILKLILVDGISPDGILATTFTKKAAAELRSRILGWGFRLTEILQNDEAIEDSTRAWIKKLDINQIVTGTIDSICDQILRDFRDPGTQPPVLIDEFVSRTLMLREGLLGQGTYRDTDLDEYLLIIRGGSRWRWHIGAKNDLLMTIWDRRWQDQVDWEDYLEKQSNIGHQDAIHALDCTLKAYWDDLLDRGMLDFALLEQEVLNRLLAGQFQEFLERIQVILIDEYQDSNLLQESIYFEMAKSCQGALFVVGDDDQSLYRFRGATVELFSNFVNRYQNVFGVSPETVFIKNNYRSTRKIINLVNEYAMLDPDYQDVRVDAKPRLSFVDGINQEGIPILGMFRDDLDILACDLADFIKGVFRGDGFLLPDGNIIEVDPEIGDLGDCALLCSSPREFKPDGSPRLPFTLRNHLSVGGIEVFNPRGQDLTGIQIVERFGGLLLECLDPGGLVEDQTSGLGWDILRVFRDWRDQSIAFAESDEVPDDLVDFAIGWAERNPGSKGRVWPRTVPVLDLVYGLVHYFPMLYDDPEGQIYLEIFTRQVTACEQVGKFSGRVVTDPYNSGLSEASIKELLRTFLGPIASGAIKVNEDLLEIFPRDRLNILSIHQAKGLEFPLVIVDIGSEFRNNHHAHAFKRYPNDGGTPHILEDFVRPSNPLGAPGRSRRDRAFDDLYRHFFLDYSPPQEGLLLAGLSTSIPGGTVYNVASGWTREGQNNWNNPLPFLTI